jgi:6-pyruvoyltetrahydropterin/6-carboxytetrahydropterin synthase
MERITTIDLHMESLKFSAAHFTIFSKTERERLHGHNFRVGATITAPVGPNGMTSDYAIFKRKLKSIVDELDEYTLIPSMSPYMTIKEGNSKEEDAYYFLNFNDETIILLKSDTLLLPIRNGTVEEYSFYLLERICEDTALLDKHGIREISVSVSSGPGQSGSTTWQRPI